ncbi:endonuclease domain-containing protein [Streptomyces sp900116325]|uniref:endonuclease domain-containing protein n=1 Tax=Streptomyces sp. 900116325 TaxID=3154295 RepID=UPI0033AA0FE7
MAAEQRHLCGLCGERSTTQKRMHVDHDHATGKIRALLCHHCNLLLGNAKDSAERLRQAIEYLERHHDDGHPINGLASKLAPGSNNRTSKRGLAPTAASAVGASNCGAQPHRASKSPRLPMYWRRTSAGTSFTSPSS